MIIILIYWAFNIACCAFAIGWGGHTGRWGGGILLLASAASLPAALIQKSWSATHYPLFAIDLACLFALLILSFTTNRFWPLWTTALHFDGVAIHIASMTMPDLVPKAYQALQTLWSIPMLLAMVFGIALDRRLGLQ